MLIKEVKQGAKIDFEKTNITISKFKVSTNHWLSTLLSSLYAFLFPFYFIFYNNKDKPTEVTIRFNNNYETRLPL